MRDSQSLIAYRFLLWLYLKIIYIVFFFSILSGIGFTRHLIFLHILERKKKSYGIPTYVSVSLARTRQYSSDTFAPKWRPKSPLDGRNLKPICIRRCLAPALRFTQFPRSHRFSISPIRSSSCRSCPRQIEIDWWVLWQSPRFAVREIQFSNAPTQSALKTKRSSPFPSTLLLLTSSGFRRYDLWFSTLVIFTSFSRLYKSPLFCLQSALRARLGRAYLLLHQRSTCVLTSFFNLDFFLGLEFWC